MANAGAGAAARRSLLTSGRQTIGVFQPCYLGFGGAQLISYQYLPPPILLPVSLMTLVQKSIMARSDTHPDWFLPVTLTAAFAAALALSLGHHYFYSTLHELRVEQARWPQQTNTSIGTAFAFLVRAACVVAISASYWQIFWRRLRRPLSVSTIDGLASQLKVIYQLLDPRTLKASPLLASLAILAWLMPLAAVFPPAALKVVPKTFTAQDVQQFQVPNYTDYKSFVASFRTGGLSKRTMSMVGPNGPAQSAAWAGPTSQVRRTLYGTAYQGQLPAFTALKSGNSYTLTFDGPAIQCPRMTNEKRYLDDLYEAGLPYMNGSWSPWAATTTNWLEPFFMAWAANHSSVYDNDEEQGSHVVPFSNSTIFRYRGIESVTTGLADPLNLGTDPDHPQALYIAYREDLVTEGVLNGGMTLLNCSLFNATYEATFSQHSQQNVNINNIMIGEAIFLEAPGASLYPAALALNTPEVQSYLAVMQAFGELLVGSLFWNKDVYVTDLTHIFETDLAFTDELYPVYVNYTGSATSKPLKPLQVAIEELFQNLTLSLLSVPDLLGPNVSTLVTSSSTHNVYQYNQLRLWSAYGAALAATLLAVTIGLFSLATTGMSYSNKFSTVVRVSRQQSVEVIIKDEDQLGQDPLPKYIGDAKLVLRSTSRKSDAESSSHESEREGLRSPGEGLITARTKGSTVRTTLI